MKCQDNQIYVILILPFLKNLLKKKICLADEQERCGQFVSSYGGGQWRQTWKNHLYRWWWVQLLLENKAQIIVLVNKKNTVSEDFTNYKNSWSAHVNQYSNTISVDPNKRIHHSNVVRRIHLSSFISLSIQIFFLLTERFNQLKFLRAKLKLYFLFQCFIF